MKRFLKALLTEVRLQYRHGFYAVSVILVLVFGALLGLLPEFALPDWLLPTLVAMSLLLTNFFFIGALVLLEKAEGTLWALATSPLRGREYLSAKAASLIALGLIETCLIIIVGFGPREITTELLIGGAALGAIYALAGFITIVRYESFNEYFLPAIGVTILLLAPLLALTGLLDTPLWLLHPAYPALYLMKGGTPWQLVAAATGALFWLLVLSKLALRVQDRYLASLNGRGGLARGGA